jgi:heme/copper-type cytochrome/quinol oxidase subunit 2
MAQRTRKGKGDRPVIAIFVIVALVVVFVLGLGIWQGLRPLVAGPAVGTKEVRVSMMGFQPDVITLKAGHPTRIALVDLDDSNHIDGGGWHDFKVPALHIVQRVAPLSTKDFVLDVTRPGTYRFFCDACCGGSADPAMNGVLVVQG